jgi:hypothetical protein
VLFWAWEGIQEYVRKDPRKAWALTLQLIAAAPDSALRYVAAGPLEDLLYARGPLFIDELEYLASSDPKFLSALQKIAGPTMRLRQSYKDFSSKGIMRK